MLVGQGEGHGDGLLADLSSDRVREARGDHVGFDQLSIVWLVMDMYMLNADHKGTSALMTLFVALSLSLTVVTMLWDTSVTDLI